MVTHHVEVIKTDRFCDCGVWLRHLDQTAKARGVVQHIQGEFLPGIHIVYHELDKPDELVQRSDGLISLDAAKCEASAMAEQWFLTL